MQHKCTQCVARATLRATGKDSLGTKALSCPVCDEYYTLDGVPEVDARKIIEDHKAEGVVIDDSYEDYEYYLDSFFGTF